MVVLEQFSYVVNLEFTMSTFTFRFPTQAQTVDPKASSTEIPDRIWIGPKISLYSAVDTILDAVERESFALITEAKNSNRFR
jgi:hypothetical protein